MFKIRNVTFKDILNVPFMDIPEHNVSTLFGESGSGKTTLMKLLNQMISYDSGAIYYKDQLITERDPIQLRREVVMLSQTPAIFEGTIRENLLIGLRFSGKKDVEDAKLIESLEKMRLIKELDEQADTLSGGEKQRLAFARIILMEAEVFLLDEPTSALDEKTENSVMDEFIDFAREQKKTVVMVTHSKSVAETYSDHVFQMTEFNRIGAARANG